MQFRVRTRAALIDVDAAGKSIQGVIRNNRVGPIIRNKICEIPSGSRTCLEPAVVPAGVEIEVIERPKG